MNLPFDDFCESAVQFGASTTNSPHQQSTNLASPLAILGYVIGIIAASLAIGFVTALGIWPVSAIIAFALCFVALKTSLKSRAASPNPDAWKWGVLQSLSCLYYLVGFSVITGNTVNNLAGWTLMALLPQIIFAAYVYVRLGRSSVVIGLNIYAAHFVFVVMFVSLLIGEKSEDGNDIELNGDVAKWYSLCVTVLVMFGLTYYKPTEPNTIRTNTLIFNLSALLIIIPLHLILDVPSTDNILIWLLYSISVILFFLLAGLNPRTTVPLLLGLLGIFIVIFKLYSWLAGMLPDESDLAQFSLATLFLGGSAVLLIMVAPSAQKWLTGFVGRFV